MLDEASDVPDSVRPSPIYLNARRAGKTRLMEQQFLTNYLGEFIQAEHVVFRESNEVAPSRYHDYQFLAVSLHRGDRISHHVPRSLDEGWRTHETETQTVNVCQVVLEKEFAGQAYGVCHEHRVVAVQEHMNVDALTHYLEAGEPQIQFQVRDEDDAHVRRHRLVVNDYVMEKIEYLGARRSFPDPSHIVRELTLEVERRFGPAIAKAARHLMAMELYTERGSFQTVTMLNRALTDDEVRELSRPDGYIDFHRHSILERYSQLGDRELRFDELRSQGMKLGEINAALKQEGYEEVYGEGVMPSPTKYHETIKHAKSIPRHVEALAS